MRIKLTHLYTAICLLFVSNNIYSHSIDSLRAVYNKGNDSVKFDVLQKIVVFFRNADLDSARAYMVKLYAMSSGGHTFRLGQSQMIEGSLYQRELQFDSAEVLYNKAIETFSSIGYTKGIVSCLNNLGTIYQERGKYVEASNYFFRHLNLSDSLGDQKELATAYVNIGLLLQEKEQYSEAIKYYNMGLELKKKTGEKRGEALLYNNLGISYYFLKDYDKVLESFKRSLAIFRSLGDLRGQAMPFFNIGEIYFEAKLDYEKALYYYNKSYEIEAKLMDLNGQATSLTRIGDCFAAMGKFEKAITIQHEALTILKKLNLPNEISEVMFSLSETYEKAGNYKNALQYYKKFKEIKDTLVSENNYQKILQVKEQYELDKKDSEIAGLIAEKKMQMVEVQSFLNYQKMRDILLTAIVVLTLITTTILFLLIRIYYKYRFLKKILGIAKISQRRQKSKTHALLLHNSTDVNLDKVSERYMLCAELKEQISLLDKGIKEGSGQSIDIALRRIKNIADFIDDLGLNKIINRIEVSISDNYRTNINSLIFELSQQCDALEAKLKIIITNREKRFRYL